MVDARDLKSRVRFGRAGSSPAVRTTDIYQHFPFKIKVI